MRFSLILTAAALIFVAGDDSGLGSEVVAAVLLYRALTYLLQVILGVLAYFIWRREARRGRPAVIAGDVPLSDH